VVACEVGNIEAVKLLAPKCIRFGCAFKVACIYDRTDIIEFLYDRVRERKRDLTRYLNFALIAVSHKGQTHIVSKLLLTKVTNLNRPLQAAAFSGRLEVVKLLVRNGANYLNSALCIASEMGHVNIICYLLSVGANSIREAIECATQGGQPHVASSLRNLLLTRS
jgi:hypothetical protein